MTYAPAPPQPKSKTLPILLGILGATVVLVGAGLAALAFWLKPAAGGQPAPAASASAMTLAAAEEACNLQNTGMKLADGGKTLIINGQGEAATDELATDWGNTRCVLANLGAPESVVQHMRDTRALDGRQTDEWGAYSAAWTYHPDDGIDLTIQQR